MIENPMHQWFIYLFDTRKDEKGYVICQECGKKMHEDTYKYLSSCYSHILSKKKYPNFKGDPDNIFIVHPNCHHIYSLEPKKAINQYKKLIELKEKHNIS